MSIGSLVPVKVEEDNQGTWFVMDGDWSKTRMMIGYQYDMKVEFPKMYPTKTQQTSRGSVTTSDTNCSLTLQRLKFNFGQTGVYEVTLERKGRDVYTELYECKTADGYPANEIAFDQSKTQIVPVYALNTDTEITLLLLTHHLLPWYQWNGRVTTPICITNVFDIHPISLEAAYQVASNLRPEDRRECVEGHGIDPIIDIPLASLRGFCRGFTVHNGETAGIVGINDGQIWMLCTPVVQQYPVAFVKEAKEFIDSRPEPYLWNVVDKRNTLHIKLLKFLDLPYTKN